MHIDMRRLSDGAIYRFDAAGPDDNGLPRFKRADKDVWIRRDADFGWIIWDATDATLMSRPWDVAVKDQGATPPEGVWVSRKGANSFVYEMTVVAG
jgi:hypothetical protein